MINNIGNLRFINKTRNVLKSNSLPDENIEFYGSEDYELKQLFIKARNNLTEETFSNFVQKRKDMIYDKVRKFLGFKR